MKKLPLIVLMSFLCPAASGADVAVESKIDAVTVFPDRADVSRSATADLPAGRHTIVFDGLPAGLMTDSLRVSGKGNAAFVIGSVETKEIHTTAPAAAREKELRDKIAALRDKSRYLDAQIQAADTGKTFLQSLSRMPASGSNDAKTVVSPEAWKNGWQVIQNGMDTLGREVIEKQIQARAVTDEISALNAQLRDIATGRKSYKQVRVNVETVKPVKARLALQYRISGASWNPLYEARLDSAKETVDIVQYGNISQHTGEDWNNVALTLSTARPFAATQPPALSPIWVDARTERPEPPVVYQAKMTRSVADSRMMMMSNFAETDEMTAESAAVGDSFDAGTIAASAVGTEFSGVFAIKGTANVPSDGACYRFNIGSYPSKAEIRAETYPAADSSAYLIATTVFNGELPLLSGDIALFRDGAFIGNSHLDMLRPNEKLHLAFGQDEKIRVTRTVLGGETSEAGVISRENRKESLSKTIVQNLHNRPLKIAVYEQLPVSRNSDVSVKIVKDKTTDGYVANPNDKVGLLKWESVWQPREKREIKYGYIVSWAKGKVLTGM